MCPIYDYRCVSCGHVSEHLEEWTLKGFARKCPNGCAKNKKRLMPAPKSKSIEDWKKEPNHADN